MHKPLYNAVSIYTRDDEKLRERDRQKVRIRVGRGGGVREKKIHKLCMKASIRALEERLDNFECALTHSLYIPHLKRGEDELETRARREPKSKSISCPRSREMRQTDEKRDRERELIPLLIVNVQSDFRDACI